MRLFNISVLSAFALACDPTAVLAYGEPSVNLQVAAIASVRPATDAEAALQCEGDQKPIVIEMDESSVEIEPKALGAFLLGAAPNTGSEVRLRRGLEVTLNGRESAGQRFYSLTNREDRETEVDEVQLQPSLSVEACLREGAVFLQSFDFELVGTVGNYSVSFAVDTKSLQSDELASYKIQHLSSAISNRTRYDGLAAFRDIRASYPDLVPDRMGYINLELSWFKVPVDALDGSGRIDAVFHVNLAALMFDQNQ